MRVSKMASALINTRDRQARTTGRLIRVAIGKIGRRMTAVMF
jgi:hypothetical protein